MIGRIRVALVAAAAAGGVLVLVILVILKKCLLPKIHKYFYASTDGQGLQNGISRLHQVSPRHHPDRDGSKKANDYHLFLRWDSTKQAFSWADQPSLVTDAVENGWSRFAFTSSVSQSPSVKSARTLLGACGAGDPDVEIDWEVCEGSADYMQKIRLAKKRSVSVIRAALPLPGPNLGNSSFPQEAFFEITILSCNVNDYDPFFANDKAGDKMKLIGEDVKAKSSPDPRSHATSGGGHSQRRTKTEELKSGKQDTKNEGVSLSVSVGLTGGPRPLTSKVPGSYPGSVGFNSSGSVYLDGTKLVHESEKDEWGRPDKVIGCGYCPSLKKVFFTVDSQLVHEIHCKTEEFGSPLYPTLAANADITVLVNLGQSPFKFAAANLQRTANPCFIGPMATSPALGYEDSKELFSMGRIDSQWLQRGTTRSNNNTVNSIRALEYDQESEGDLFEIVLESTARSLHTTTTPQ